MPLAPGAKLGPYEILTPLGIGGMGEVYRARDTRLGRTVAIKVLPELLSQNSDLRQRLEQEARAISSLSHPNICTLHDIGHHDEMDFLVGVRRGQTLRQLLASGNLPCEGSFPSPCRLPKDWQRLTKSNRPDLSPKI
jgi:serine/threonine protein kinase